MQDESRTVEGRATPLGAYPHVRLSGGFAFVSGTSSRRADNSIAGAEFEPSGRLHTDIRVQTRAVFANVAEILASVGAGLDDIVDVTTFLVDMHDFAGYNEVYAQIFGEAELPPARTTVAVAELPHPHLRIEVKAVARLRSDAERSDE